MKRKFLNFGVFAFILTLTGCGGSSSSKKSEIDFAISKPDVRASSNIRDSFGYASLEFDDADNSHLGPVQDNVDFSSNGTRRKNLVKIKTSALDKEFLLRASMVYQLPSPEFAGLKTRVVAFSLQDDKLFLFEATKGHQVDESFDSRIVLATFDIIEENENWISFDFNRGFSQLFIGFDWRAQDFEGSFYRPDYDAIGLRNSFIDQINIDEPNNSLSVRQTAQLDLSYSNWGSILRNSLSVQVVYFLSPYQPNPDFKPHRQVYRDFREQAYFEIAPQMNPKLDTPFIYATKFQLDGKNQITAAISGNTPEDVKEAVKDGILYWNRAFGYDAIQVVEAPTGVSAPNSQYDLLVQWVDFETAGFAYADAQADPRTGETLNAQIYMSSFWAILGKAEAQQKLKILNDLEKDEAKKALDYRKSLRDHHDHRPLHPSLNHSHNIGLRGFENPRLCNRQVTAQFAQRLSSLVAKDVSDEIIQRASLDAIREVVAHEVGHTLGLRHNFAGSLAVNYDLDERSELVNSYLNGEEVPAHMTPASSVMDYLVFDDQVIAGNIVGNHERRALAYDEQAIQRLYFDKKIEAEDRALYCSDLEIGMAGMMDWGGYVDCMVFDFGNNYFDFLISNRSDYMENLPYLLMSRFINAKAPVFGDTTLPVEAVYLDPALDAIFTQLYNWDLFASMTDYGAYFLSIRRQFGREDGLESEIIKKDEEAYIAGEIERLGGFQKAAAIITPEEIQAAHDKFLELTKNIEFTSGRSVTGLDYKFSKSELKIIRERADQFFAKLKEEMARADLMMIEYGLENPLMDHPVGNQVYDALADRVQQYVFGTKIEGGIVQSIRVPDRSVSDDSETDGLEIEDGATVTPEVIEKIALKVARAMKEAEREEKDAGRKMKSLSLSLPAFIYPQDIRSSAASIISSVSSTAPDWGIDEAEKYHFYTQMKDLLEQSFGGQEVDELRASDFRVSAIRRWYMENTEIFSNFSPTEAEQDELDKAEENE